jgi:hypothetical protein
MPAVFTVFVQLVTWLLVLVVIFSIVYFLAVFAAELYVICAPRRASKGKDKEYAGKTDKAIDVAMNPMFTSAALARRRSTMAPAADGARGCLRAREPCVLDGASCCCVELRCGVLSSRLQLLCPCLRLLCVCMSARRLLVSSPYVDVSMR